MVTIILWKWPWLHLSNVSFRSSPFVSRRFPRWRPLDEFHDCRQYSWRKPSESGEIQWRITCIYRSLHLINDIVSVSQSEGYLSKFIPLSLQVFVNGVSTSSPAPSSSSSSIPHSQSTSDKMDRMERDEADEATLVRVSYSLYLSLFCIWWFNMISYKF